MTTLTEDGTMQVTSVHPPSVTVMVLSVCTALFLHLLRSLPNITLWEENGSDGPPCWEGLLRFQEAKAHRSVPLKSLAQGSQQGYSKQSSQFIKWSCPLYSNCKVTAS